MAPSFSAVCALVCLGTSSAFVAPPTSCWFSSRGITAHCRSVATVGASASTAPSRKRLSPLFMAGEEVDPEIMAKVKQIVVSQLAVEESQVVPEASFTQDLGADSLDTVELIMALEEGFDIEIEDEVAAEIGTVKEAVDFIAKTA